MRLRRASAGSLPDRRPHADGGREPERARAHSQPAAAGPALRGGHRTWEGGGGIPVARRSLRGDRTGTCDEHVRGMARADLRSRRGSAIAIRELIPFAFRLRRVIRRHGIGLVHVNDAPWSAAGRRRRASDGRARRRASPRRASLLRARPLDHGERPCPDRRGIGRCAPDALAQGSAEGRDGLQRHDHRVVSHGAQSRSWSRSAREA